jgi:hypothetical protein
MSIGLVRYENARRALAEARRVDEVKEIRDKAIAMREYSKQARDRDLLDWVTEIKLRAEERGGEMLREMADKGERRGDGRPWDNGSAAQPLPKLADLGVTKTQSSHWQKLAAMPKEKFEAMVEAVKKKTLAAFDGAKPNRTSFTGENQWFTPEPYIKLARTVLGEIDLDPASHKLAQKVVMAGRFFSEEDDGLKQKWFGRIWLNPPYAQPQIGYFSDKMVAEMGAGHVDQAIMLTHNYAWFQKLAAAAAAICFTSGRIRFVSPFGELAAPTQGQAFFYFGVNTGKFVSAFGATGFVVGRALRGGS